MIIAILQGIFVLILQASKLRLKEIKICPNNVPRHCQNQNYNAHPHDLKTHEASPYIKKMIDQ